MTFSKTFFLKDRKDEDILIVIKANEVLVKLSQKVLVVPEKEKEVKKLANLQPSSKDFKDYSANSTL